VSSLFGEGDYVTACGDMTMKENGVAVPYAYCDVYRFRGDAVAEMKSFVIKTAGK
jgi:pectate lyase